jgi:hypothetical protein
MEGHFKIFVSHVMLPVRVWMGYGTLRWFEWKKEVGDEVE